MSNPFSAATFTFLTELRRHNNKAWFEANRQRYIDAVRDPFMAFIKDFNPRLKSVSEHYHGVEKTNGGALFRIYRDTRFSKDKTPYKSWAGARFTHIQGGRQGAPIFYLHLQPGQSFFAAGIWRPATPMVNQIRTFLHNNPGAWQRLTGDRQIRSQFHWGGDSLKRMPRGFDPEHPLAEDLKRKDFVLVSTFTDAQVTGARFPGMMLKRCQRSAPFVDYLCAALDLEF